MSKINKRKKKKVSHKQEVLLLIDKEMRIIQLPKDYQEQEKIKVRYY